MSDSDGMTAGKSVVRRDRRIRQITCHKRSVCLRLFSSALGKRGGSVAVVSALDSGAEGPGFKSQPRCCRVTVLGKLFTPVVPPFTKQRNW